MINLFDIKGKVALITGSTHGLGMAMAKGLGEAGATIVVNGNSSQQKIDDAVAALKSEGINAVGYKFNVTEEQEVKAAVAKIESEVGPIDILINNAGITLDGFLTKMEESDWERVISVNLSGVFKCTKAVAPTMLKQGSGVILNASSVVGLYGNIGQTNYAATKAGVIGLTKSWAKEFGPKGIRVNAVAPGFIETGMTAAVPDKVLQFMKEKTPLRKLGKPEDIAAAYVFLASDKANYINGTILSVDGGLVI